MNYREKQKLEKEKYKFKEQELYKVALSAFVNNSLELDKIIITLSIASIGGYITYILKYLELNTKIDILILVSISLSITFFLATSWIVLEIFKENKKYLQQILQDKYKDSPKLTKLDNLRDIFFKMGIFFSILFAIIVTTDKINSYKKEEVLYENNLTNFDKYRLNIGATNQKFLNSFANYSNCYNNYEDNISTVYSLNSLGCFYNNYKNSISTVYSLNGLGIGTEPIKPTKKEIDISIERNNNIQKIITK